MVSGWNGSVVVVRRWRERRVRPSVAIAFDIENERLSTPIPDREAPHYYFTSNLPSTLRNPFEDEKILRKSNR
jgi:hypothetical protein